MIRLGSHVKDIISGFKGVVTGRVEYLTGCNQCLVSPAIGKDGAARDAHWFDEQRLQIQKGKPVTLDNGTAPGPDKPAPVR